MAEDDKTMWSKTLLDGFIKGMKKSPSKAWIKEQAAELAERGMSVDYVYKLLRKDVNDVAAERFLHTVGGSSPASRARRRKKVGLIGQLLNKLFGR